jgi:hypothetical protein
MLYTVIQERSIGCGFFDQNRTPSFAHRRFLRGMKFHALAAGFPSRIAGVCAQALFATCKDRRHVSGIIGIEGRSDSGKDTA